MQTSWYSMEDDVRLCTRFYGLLHRIILLSLACGEGSVDRAYIGAIDRDNEAKIAICSG